MNGLRTLLTAMTLIASLAWAGDAASQTRKDPRGSDVNALRSELTCSIYGAWDPGNWWNLVPSPIVNGRTYRFQTIKDVWVGLTIVNEGGRDSGPFQWALRVTNNGRPVAVGDRGDREARSLEPGGRTFVGRQGFPLTSGTVDRYGKVHRPATNEIVVTGAVDIGNVVMESNKTDNQCTMQFTIVVDH